MGKKPFQVNLSALPHYDKKLLDKPLKELTGEEAVIQLQFLSSPYAQQEDSKKGVRLGLTKEHHERINALGEMLAQGFVCFNYGGKAEVKPRSESFV